MPSMISNHEILIQKVQRDQIQSDITTLKAAIKQETENRAYEQEMLREKYSRKISELQREKEDKTAKNKNNVEMINRATSEIMNNYEEKIQ